MLLVIFIIIWILGLIWIAKPTIDGFQAIPEYFETKEKVESRKLSPNFSYENDYIFIEKFEMAKGKLWGLTAIPVYILFFYVLPWLLLRLIFWIKTADNVKKI